MVSRIHRRSADQKRLGDPKPYGKNDNGDDKNEFYKIKKELPFSDLAEILWENFLPLSAHNTV